MGLKFGFEYGYNIGKYFTKFYSKTPAQNLEKKIVIFSADASHDPLHVLKRRDE